MFLRTDMGLGCRLIFLALTFGVAFTIGAAAQEVGPPDGSLVIVGGSMQDPAILDHFLALAGGADQPIVVIPTAGSADAYDTTFAGLRGFRQRNVADLTLLHTRDRAVADSDSFVTALHRARGVWFSGGRQWRLADAYLDTATESALWDVLRRGGVIGGSSAGATIQGSYLARGDTRTNTIMMGDHEEGFAFLKQSAIDQHLLRRNRQFDLVEIIEALPELLGIGIDENTAIVVRRDTFQVIGQSYVAIYDHGTMLQDAVPFYLLAPGDTFNLVSREAFRGGNPLRPRE